MGVLSKILGAGTAGVVLYNAAAKGSNESKKSQTATSGNRITDEYLKSLRLDSYDEFGNGVKKRLFGAQLSWGLPEFASSIGGFFSGIVGSLTDAIVPAALATGAILSNGTLGKACGVGLALNAVKYFAYDILGIGKSRVTLGKKT